MLQIRVRINNDYQYLDLFDNEDIRVNASVAEIQDITKKNSSFTRDFNIPGSKNNNNIFQNYYDAKSVYINQDIQQKLEAEILYDGYEIMRGYIRLNEVSKRNSEILYNVNFYNQVGDLAANLGDKFMRQLNLSYLSHPFNASIAGEGLVDFDLANSAYDNYTKSGTTYWNLTNKGYQYLLDSGGTETNVVSAQQTPILEFAPVSQSGQSFSYVDNPVRYYYYTPNIRIQELYKQVLEQSGYELESNFMDTAYFKRFYLPLKFSDTMYPLQSFPPEYAFSAATPAYSARTFYFCQNETCSIANPGVGGTDFLLPPETDYIDNITADTNNGISFELRNPGQYQFRATFTAVNQDTGANNIILYLIRQFSSATSVSGYSMDNAAISISGGTTGRTVTFDFFIDSYNTAPDLTNYFSLNLTFSKPASAFNYIKDFNFELVNNEFSPRYTVGDFDYNLEFPEDQFTQIEFITNVNKLFNLVVIPDSEYPNKLRVEPIVDYFNSGPVLDWTNKVDYDSNIIISPINNYIDGELGMNLVEDKDVLSQNFRNLKGRNFGLQNVQLNQDYKNNKINVDTIFASQVDYTLDVPGIQFYPTLASHYVIENKDFSGETIQFLRPFEVAPQLMYRGLNIPTYLMGEFNTTGATYLGWNIETSGGVITNIQMFPNNNRYNTYPYGISGFTHSANFQKTDVYDPKESDLTCYEDLYDIYYSDYIDDLTSVENRLMKCLVYLTPQEISSLNFDEKIYIDGVYWRINKIDYSLLNPGMAKVEFTKITQDYRPHRVRYYQLNPCASGSTLYTNTDLNATIYAYVGKYIKLDDGKCYQIQNSTYNTGYTYQRVNNFYYYSASGLDKDYTPVIFDTCSSCTGTTTGSTTVLSARIANVYNELNCNVPEPEPSPTPTQTPTLTKTPTQTKTPTPTLTPTSGYCNCLNYRATANEFEPLPVSYLDCNLVSQEISIPRGESQTFCACEGSVDATGGTLEIIGVCATPTPTQTKTPTPTPTPTITPTATSCECYNYSITNSDLEGSGSYEAILCENGCESIPTVYIIGPGQSIEICACNDSVSAVSGMLVITKGSCCTAPTPTPTSTLTPTITDTPTQTPTPTSTPPPSGDPDAEAYLTAVENAGGTRSDVIDDAVETLFKDLKDNSLYDKLYTFYPFVGGVEASNALNGKRSMGITYDLTFNGSWTHDADGSLGNTSNTYADTHYIPFNETTFSAFTFGFYNTNYTTVNGEYYNGSINNTSPQKWAAFRAQASSTRFNVAVSGGLTRNVDAGQQGLYIGTTTTGNTHSICYNGTVSTGNGVSGDLPTTSMYVGALNLDGSRYGSINMKYVFWFNSNVRMSTSEMTTLSTIINTFQTTLGRNTY